MSELTPAQLHQLQTSLTNIRKEMEQQLLLGKTATDTVVLDQSAIGRVSRMDAIQQQSVAVTTRDQTLIRLKQVIAALLAITEDDYGYCHNCGETIDFKRLEVQPESRLCLACQSKADAA